MLTLINYLKRLHLWEYIYAFVLLEIVGSRSLSIRSSFICSQFTTLKRSSYIRSVSKITVNISILFRWSWYEIVLPRHSDKRGAWLGERIKHTLSAPRGPNITNVVILGCIRVCIYSTGPWNTTCTRYPACYRVRL